MIDSPPVETVAAPPATLDAPVPAEPVAPVVQLRELDERPRANKRRAPKDAARRELEAEAEAIRRELRGALKSRDVEQLRAMRTRKAAATDAPTVKAGAPMPVATPVINIVPTPPASRGPAWPSEAAIDGFKGMVAPLVGVGCACLKDTRFAIGSDEVEFEIGGKTIVTSKQAALTDALSALAAKYLPNDVNTPEAYAGAVLFMCFGGPLLSPYMAKLEAKLEAA